MTHMNSNDGKMDEIFEKAKREDLKPYDIDEDWRTYKQKEVRETVKPAPDPEDAPITELKAWVNQDGTVEFRFKGRNLVTMKTFLEEMTEMLQGF